jgi:CheY-like chemotaxis protein
LWCPALDALRRRELDCCLRGTAAERKSYPVTSQEQSRLLRRAARIPEVLRDASILWVEDDHTLTAPERQALSSLGAEIVEAETTDEAVEYLTHSTFDVVISDMDRAGNSQAGLELLSWLRGHPQVPVIFYIADVDPDGPDPAGSFGLTDRPDELLHLVMDALVRRRG